MNYWSGFLSKGEMWKEKLVVKSLGMIHNTPMSTVTEIMDNVLDLPRVDRSYLVKKLLESLEVTDSLTVNQRSMIDRRSSEMAKGKVKPLSMEQLKQEVAKRLA